MNNNSPHIEPELLSAYLDNEVTTAERAVIEAHLPGCVACQTELASLRWMVSLVQTLPQPSVPRTFYITEAMLSPEPTPRQAAPWWRVFAPWGALVAALLVIVVFAQPMFMNGGAPSSDTATVEYAPAAAPQIAVAPTGAAAGGAPVPTDSSARSSDTLTLATAETAMDDTAEAADTAIAPESTQVKIEDGDGTAGETTTTESITTSTVNGADTQASDVTAAESAPPIEQSTLSDDTPTAANTTVIIATIVVLLVVIAAVIVRGMRA